MDGALRIFEESLAYTDALEPKSPNQADALERIIGSMGILSAMYQGEESIRMKEIELLLSQDNISSFLTPTQAKRNLSSRSGIGGVRSAT